ncbi:Zn2/Cys6 DNA-binding protein [Glarea lozoyensis ATCC 20868]|uniref:Zn2/Cys6 DNA-binding protein n=1 Tax=Glarea lozoyensis (strain ATCC 20868 / MF5171) TaxID=1116229 RepID=S3CKW9_GLAL2|nr:Zn2/Cys6 DNA-binding protein [Glarea lozoyensis ATCC 20868]EPE25839.1 Zn2/Cys6 DNA-binding protein [Glarea lozoyensis ATCC 20868]
MLTTNNEDILATSSRPPPQKDRNTHEVHEEPHLTVACRRCRKQKLRCTRDSPACKRCKDLSVPCSYPPPPDRKLLANQRWQNAKARAQADAGRAVNSTEQHQLPLMSSVITTSLTPASNGQQKTGGNYSVMTIDETLMPPPDVADFLIELYFKHFSHSSLLFHKETFLGDFAAGRIADFVAMSVFALATVSLRGTGLEEDMIKAGDTTVSKSKVCEQGRAWAVTSNLRTLSQCDIPKVETIQACQNLALYWYSNGEVARTHMHGHIAWKTAQSIYANQLGKSGKDSEFNRHSHEAEMSRRTYWAAWLSCIVQNEDAATKPWQRVPGLLLPSDDSYECGRMVKGHFFDENGYIQQIESVAQGSTRIATPEGAMLVLFALWSEIRSFVDSCAVTEGKDVSQIVATFLDLDTRLGLVLNRLGPEIRYPEFSRVSKVPIVRSFFLNSIYRLCSMSLHSALVPVFSTYPPHLSIPKRMVRLSAEEVVKQASITLDMASAFLSTDPDFKNVPSTTAYTLLVAITIHFKSLVAQKKLRVNTFVRFKAALIIIKRIRIYWTTLNMLWEKLEMFFKDAGFDINVICGISDRFTNPDDQPADIEKIVSTDSPRVNGCSTKFSDFIADSAHCSSGVSDSQPSSVCKSEVNPRTPASSVNNARTTRPLATQPPLPGRNIHSASKVSGNSISSILQAEPQPQTQKPLHQQALENQRGNTSHTAGFWHLEASGERQQLHANTLQTTGLTAVPNDGMSTLNHPAAPRQLFDPSMAPFESEMLGDQLGFWWDQSYESLEPVTDPQLYYHTSYPYNPYSFG